MAVFAIAIAAKAGRNFFLHDCGNSRYYSSRNKRQNYNTGKIHGISPHKHSADEVNGQRNAPSDSTLTQHHQKRPFCAKLTLY